LLGVTKCHAECRPPGTQRKTYTRGTRPTRSLPVLWIDDAGRADQRAIHIDADQPYRR